MIGALDSAVSSYADAARILESALARTRSQWDDATRRDFDSQHLNQLLSYARQSATELTQLAQELNAAARLLVDSG